MGQRGPQEAGELARDGGDDVLFGFAARRQAPVASVQPMLRMPGLLDDGRGRPALTEAERPSKKGMMPVLPRGLDQHPPQMCIPRFRDPAAGLFRPTGILRRDKAGKRHDAGGGGKAPCIAQFGRDGQGGEIVNAAEAAEAFDAGAQRLDGEEVAELGIHRLQSPDGFIDRPHVRAMGLLECGDRPALPLQPGGMAFRPRLLRPGEATAVPQEKLREPVSRAQQIRANIFATAQQIARRLFLLAGNVNGGERARSVQHRQLAGIAPIGLDAIAGPPRDQGWRDHVTGNVIRGQRTLQIEAAGPCFTATKRAWTKSSRSSLGIRTLISCASLLSPPVITFSIPAFHIRHH